MSSAGTVAARPYRPPVPRLWWLRRRSYLLFMLRELSCLFVAWFVMLALLLVVAVGDGPGAYRDFLDWSARPWVIALNVIATAFVLLHAVTWFNLAPKAIVVRLGKRSVPPAAVLAAHYALWAACSAIAAWVILR
ncbi:fumarate reductase [Rhodococcus sp. UNC363MFTsu5.1]|uniref:fumarate reductase n=1 Tax=Rhodococcus sp. UNC363MFTsu5.1 TaxID=1449069 RepID=UPI0005658AF4|nr:fumarate reductase [Rhodococcus sp. UNC363MFTsu5.1]